MSAISSTGIPATALVRRLHACCDGVARYFSHRAAIAALMESDDCALRDIGLARSQIEAAVHGFIKRPDQARK